MTDSKKLFILTGIISNFWYTVIEGPISDKVLYGTWLTALYPSALIPSYIIGLILTLWVPCDKWAGRIQEKMFPATLKSKWKQIVFCFLFAVIFEFIYGLLCRIYFVLLLPSGDHSLFTVWSEFFRTYYLCLIPNMLISLFLLSPSEKLAKKILKQ